MSDRFNSNYEKEKISTSILKNNLFNPESSEDEKENSGYRGSNSPFQNSKKNKPNKIKRNLKQ